MSENLLQEFNEFDYVVEELNEDGSPKKFKLKGIYQASGIPNGNKRVYPEAVLSSAISNVQNQVAEKRMLGELDHPADAKIHLDRVSHVVTLLEMNTQGQVYGEAEVLPTASGKILEALLKSGVKLGISSRGFGSTKANDKGLDEVQNDYKLVTFDIVSDPSTPGAYPQAVYEEKENVEKTKKKEDEDDDDVVVTNLRTLLDDVLDDGVEIVQEEREFICSDDDNTRFYIVEGEKESYGFLNFHISHDYHILIKNEDYQERVGFNEENIEVLKNIHGRRIAEKILKRVDELGFSSETLTRKKED